MDLALYIGNKIKYYRNINKLTQDELGEKLGVKKATISHYENGIRTPDQDYLFELADIFSISIDDLFPPREYSGILSIYSKLEPPRQQKIYTYAERQLEEQNKTVSLNDYIDETMYGYLSAGSGEFLTTDIKENVQIPKSIVPDQHYDLVLQVNGDSMEPMFEDKEFVFVRKTEEIRSGQIGVLIVNGESYLKKVYIHDDHLRLVSLNTKYDDLTFDSLDDIEVIGTVVM